MAAVRSADLTYGQRYLWWNHHVVPAGARHDMHIVLHYPLPAGTTVASVRSAINYLVRRHEVLRTTYQVDGAYWPQQRVEPPAAPPLRHVTTESDGSVSPADAINELTVADFDLAGEWPVRACVVTTGGAPTRLVLVLNHIAFDDWGVDLLKREFDSVLAAARERRPAPLTPVSHQPADLAADEARQVAARGEALAHWRREVALVPADMLARRRGGPGGPEGAHSGSLTSPQLLAAGQDVASRHRSWPSVVYQTTYVMLVAAYAGQWHTVHRSFASRRESSRYLDVMTCMFTPNLVAVDLSDDPPFSEALGRVEARNTICRHYSDIAYDEIVELLAHESFRRGQPIHTGCEFNFLNRAPESCQARRDRYTRHPAPSAWARAGTDTYFHAHEWSDGVTVALRAQSSVMDADDVERFLRIYVRLIEAHRGTGVDLRVSEVADMAGFGPPQLPRAVHLGTDIVDLDRVEATLQCHPEVLSCRVTPTDSGLVADVTARRPVAPTELRTHFLDRMYDHQPNRCPSWFRVHAAPAGPGATPSATEGDGSRSEAVPAATVAEETLATVVAGINGLGQVDLSDSYPVAGGRALRIPQVLAEVAARGWCGLSVAHLASAVPLRALASRLRPATERATAAPPA